MGWSVWWVISLCVSGTDLELGEVHLLEELLILVGRLDILECSYEAFELLYKDISAFILVTVDNQPSTRPGIHGRRLPALQRPFGTVCTADAYQARASTAPPVVCAGCLGRPQRSLPESAVCLKPIRHVRRYI